MAAQPVLLLAPHLRLPARNGADVYVDGLARGLSRLSGEASVLGATELVSYADGSIIERRPIVNPMRSRTEAVARTLVRSSHYFLERFVTPRYIAHTREALESGRYSSAIYSFLTTAHIGELIGIGCREAVLTHNDEFKWFDDLERHSSNPLFRRIARNSTEWLQACLERRQHDLDLLHVTAEDLAGWARRFPAHRGHVVPIGVDVADRPAPALTANQPVRLLFVGALSVQMNYDAIAHFEQRYWPVLRQALGAALQMVVVGSDPPSRVRALVQRAGWTLRPNVSDAELDKLFSSATFSVLPFAYATGAKLKLLKSLSYGVPVLTTTALEAQRELLAPPSLMSDEPATWAHHIARVRAEGIARPSREAMMASALRHSWVASARALLASLNDPEADAPESGIQRSAAAASCKLAVP